MNIKHQLIGIIIVLLISFLDNGFLFCVAAGIFLVAYILFGEPR